MRAGPVDMIRPCGARGAGGTTVHGLAPVANMKDNTAGLPAPQYHWSADPEGGILEQARMMGITMGKATYLIAIVFTAALGAFLAAGYGEDDRGRWWVRKHLEVIQDQLAGLKKQLQSYKASHGHYPTNDEGLAALDNYEARFVVTFYDDTDGPVEWRRGFYRGNFSGYWWKVSRRSIGEYRQQHGHVPRNAKEFRFTRVGMLLEPPRCQGFTAVPMEIAIGADDNIFLMSPAGVLSPWLTPYGYENRNGIEPSKFNDSPANSDSQGRYSVVVDDGVFLYSTGGQVYAEQLHKMWWEDNWPRFFGGALLLVAVSLVVITIRSSKMAAITGVAALLVSGGAGGLMGGFSHTTCYIMMPLFHRRDAEMVVRQKHLLDKYHLNGVIGDKTYQRAISAIERGPSTRPADAPGEEE